MLFHLENLLLLCIKNGFDKSFIFKSAPDCFHITVPDCYNEAASGISASWMLEDLYRWYKRWVPVTSCSYKSKGGKKVFIKCTKMGMTSCNLFNDMFKKLQNAYKILSTVEKF